MQSDTQEPSNNSPTLVKVGRRKLVRIARRLTRISLIILDSTVEIAYKEYLVNEKKIGMTRFNAIAQNRAEVQKEVAKGLRLSVATQKKIDYYYKLRCNLIHQQATPAISDSEIAVYREVVENLLQRMFRLSFA
jgi:hypothetical protein